MKDVNTIIGAPNYDEAFRNEFGVRSQWQGLTRAHIIRLGVNPETGFVEMHYKESGLVAGWLPRHYMPCAPGFSAAHWKELKHENEQQGYPCSMTASSLEKTPGRRQEWTYKVGYPGGDTKELTIRSAGIPMNITAEKAKKIIHAGFFLQSKSG